MPSLASPDGVSDVQESVLEHVAETGTLPPDAANPLPWTVLLASGQERPVEVSIQPDRPDTAVVDSREDADRAELHELHPAALPEDLAGALEVLAGALPEAFRLDQVGDRSHG